SIARSGDLLTSLDGKSVHRRHREMLRKLDAHRKADARKKPSALIAKQKTRQHAPMADPGSVLA
ncbi:unnamed protein product, partial [Choristocarpus tenellus]